MSRATLPRLLPLAALLLATGFSVPGPCSFDSHAELDCGRLDNHGTTCSGSVDCEELAGADWACRDGSCVKDCPEGKACDADGFCKPTTTACKDGELSCGSHCIDASEVEAHTELCCGSCEEGELCCRHGDGHDSPGYVDVGSDPDNCGSCLNACFGVSSQCVEGQCSMCVDDADCAALNPGHTTPRCCAPICVDADSDRLNCQTCGHDCSTEGETIYCHGGSCLDRGRDNFCGASEENCLASGNICDTSLSPIACGYCDAFDPTRICAEGYECTTDLSLDTVGYCLPRSSSPSPRYSQCFEDGTTNPCGPGESCMGNLWGSNTYCLKPCRLLASDCGNDEVCYAFGQMLTVGACVPACPCPALTLDPSNLFSSCNLNATVAACEAVCGPTGVATSGDNCDFIGAQCGPGLTCVRNGTAGVCKTTCSTTDPCVSGTCSYTDVCGGEGYCTP